MKSTTLLLPNVLPSGDVITYIIDGQNRRVGKNLNGTLVQGFIYQSQTQIAAELDGSGNVVKQFIYGTKSNIPDYMIYAGNKYRIISDQVGTPQLIVNTQTGAVLEQPVYDEFGVPAHGQTSSVIPFGFAGGIMDYDVKLVRMGARDYSYFTGRFVSKDPLLFGGGSTNLYSYSINDPINYIDPTGKSPWAILLGVLAGVIYSTDTDTHGAAQAEIVGVPLSVASGWAAGGGICKVTDTSVQIRQYPNSGGGGIGLYRNNPLPGQSKNIFRFDFHPLEPEGPYLPHVDIPGVVKHWPWEN